MRFTPRKASIGLVLLLAASAPAQAFDHGAFDRLLRATVRNGVVDYAAVAKRPELAAYVATLAKADPTKLSPDDRLAFWINAYNALVLKSVVERPGLARPLDVKGFFDVRRHSVAGRSLTLNQIEHDIIRPSFNDPLIHFGLVCAAVSCPQLLSEAYTGRTVRARLAQNARRYLASSENRVDVKARRVELSQIFEWYAKDFGGDAGLRAFLERYAPPAFGEVLSSGGRITYRTYDWRLNGKWG